MPSLSWHTNIDKKVSRNISTKNITKKRQEKQSPYQKAQGPECLNRPSKGKLLIILSICHIEEVKNNQCNYRHTNVEYNQVGYQV